VSAGAPVLTVVGCGPAWTNPGEPCSSYLVEAGGARILLDCGPGAFAAFTALDPRPLDAVVLSHLHFDHCGDLVPFGYSRRYAALKTWEAPRLIAPPGGLERLAALCLAGGAARDHLDGPFALEEYRPGTAVSVGEAVVTFAALPHPGVSHAIRVDAAGRALCFSGDTGRTPSLAAHASGVDLLVCEATQADTAPSDHVHLSAADAGAVATAAGAGRLVLVHLDADKRARAATAASAAFAGRVDAAVPGDRFTTTDDA
jgi:ribonuclease BN (tRNA processing enzyme)